MPELPTPPNGTSGFAKYVIVSLMHTPPEETSGSIISLNDRIRQIHFTHVNHL
ncbi:hypothetical protein [Paenibacillus harenae]|uniref:hypothetical protein n=1 Tax=Paenibacillus harenae TaxID=306543 RepID=UPI00403A4679